MMYVSVMKMLIQLRMASQLERAWFGLLRISYIKHLLQFTVSRSEADKVQYIGKYVDIQEMFMILQF